MADRIIAHFPAHRIYVEPFGGAASVLLQKDRSYCEIYNDLDDDVVNLFGVLRDPDLALEIERLIMLTPFARSEFDLAYQPANGRVEQARRLLVRSFMGHGNISYRTDRTTGFRRNATRSGTTPARDWANYPPAIAAIACRLQGVIVEKRDALEVIGHFDGRETLIYVDPPYVHTTRSDRYHRNAAGVLAPSCGYRHEMTAQQHAELLAVLMDAKSMIVLSGYATDLYDEALTGWKRIELASHADGARDRVEVLWINPAAAQAHGLFL